ncbi:MAG: hypothetical protein HGA85_09200, partial [Nanoarchaeota archaeon]|nr:hypothetical protein [Nanoarchaeota archaeon]
MRPQRHMLLMLSALLVLFLAAGQATPISIAKESFFPGETVIIEIAGDTNGLSGDIMSSAGIYKYPSVSPVLRFQPQQQGTYRFNLYKDKTIVGSKGFNVKAPILPHFTLSASSLQTGTKLRIFVFNFTPSTILTVTAEDQSITYPSVSNELFFYPKKPGTYTASISSDGKLIQSEIFIVDEDIADGTMLNIAENQTVPAEAVEVGSGNGTQENEPPIEAPATTKKFSFDVVNSKGYLLDTEITLHPKDKRNVDINTLSYVQLPPGRYDISMKPNVAGIEMINLTSVELVENFSLGLEEVSKERTNLDAKKVYAINPAAINFSSGELTVTAKGSRLLKCKDWDFSAQECKGEWAFIMQIYPGENYSLAIDAVDPAYAE